LVADVTHFNNMNYEWRRWASELVGTFFLVIVAAGAPMMNQAFDQSVGRVAAVVAPGVMVMAMIMFMGRVSGAHFNPGVTLAFSLRGDFPWKRVPGYLIAQFIGAVLAVLIAQWIIGVSGSYGGTYPAASSSPMAAFWIELILTFGLLSVILGTASGAQNIGIIGAIGVGGYIALAGLWASPLSGASMNTWRTLGPNIVANDYTSTWVYVAGPLLGAAVAVGFASILRGAGGGTTGSLSAQGILDPHIRRPGRAPETN
jgi:aquaporin Z